MFSQDWNQSALLRRGDEPYMAIRSHAWTGRDAGTVRPVSI